MRTSVVRRGSRRRGDLSRLRWRGHDDRGNPDGDRAGTTSWPRGRRCRAAQRMSAEVRAGRTREGAERSPKGGLPREASRRASDHRACGDRAACRRSWRQLAAAEVTRNREAQERIGHRRRGNAADGATDAGVARPRGRAGRHVGDNDEGARAGGDAGSAAHAGKALKGRHRRGGHETGRRRRATAGEPSRRGPKPGEPQGRQQDATSLHASRRSKPSRW